MLEWFAERVDRIILLFDAHKLDISDEFSEVIRALKNHEDKMRVVLNKADQISTQQLMRVYGALMWSLGKIINTPEVKINTNSTTTNVCILGTQMTNSFMNYYYQEFFSPLQTINN